MLNINLSLKGLFTFANELVYPEGALVEAKNVVIDKEDVAEPRRGFKQYGDPLNDINDRFKQLLVYKGRLLRHYQNLLDFDNGDGTFTEFNGNYTETETGLRIKGLEANGNFYFTTDRGIQKISAESAEDIEASSIIQAGGVKALEVEAEMDFSASGFLKPESKTAYRVVWGYRDNNGIVVLGSPSPKVEVVNRQSGATVSDPKTGVVRLAFPIPNDIQANLHFYQIYRTPVVERAVGTVDEIEVGEDYNLVIEDFPTPSELSSQEVTVTDIQPEDLRAVSPILYTSRNAGEGINQSNDPPPVAKDIAVFRNSMFYANTQTAHRKLVDLLGVTNFTSGTSDFIVADEDGAQVYTFVGERSSTLVDVDGFPGNLLGTYFLAESYEKKRTYYIYFTDGSTIADPNPNNDWIGIPVDISTASTDTEKATAIFNELDDNDTFGFDFTVTQDGTELLFLAANNGETNGVTEGDAEGSITNITSANPAVITSAGHNLNTNDYVLLTGTGVGALDGNYFEITVIDEDTFSVPVDGTPGSATGTWTKKTGFSFTQVSTGQGEDAAAQEIRLSGFVSPALAIDDTTRSLTKVINKNSDDVVNTFYISGSDTLPGQLNFERKSLENKPFFLASTDPNVANSFNPTISLARTVTIPTGSGDITLTLNNHGFTNNQQIIVTESTSTPSLNGFYRIKNVTTNTFDITIDDPVTVSGTALVFNTFDKSDNEIRPNRLYFSKADQPEAVPRVNFVDVGAQDKPIRRILALRDSLFVLKDDGVFRIHGAIAPNFQISLLDNSAIIIAPDSAAILNNRIYMLSTQGVSTVSETGTGIISRQIEDQVVKLNAQQFDMNKTSSFAFASESDRAYFLWVMDAPSDTVATKCLRFNIFTNSWTEWPIAKLAGVINTEEDLIYLIPDDLNQIEQERKSLQRQDYVDREFQLQITATSVAAETINLTSIAGVKIGDALIQNQTVTIEQFNRLLIKLDGDPGYDDTDYFETLEFKAGQNLANKINGLVVKLNDDDSGESYDSTINTDFESLQADFNTIIAKLNGTSSDAFFQNYQISTGTVSFEGIVEALELKFQQVTLDKPIQFVQGEVIHKQSIETSITWAPQHFQNPAALKQVREGTFVFKRTNFSKCTLQYRSDLSFDFEGGSFNAFGPGHFGGFNNGGVPWGGGGNSTPLRTLIPRNKQRCRFLQPRFSHQNALESYQLYGLTLVARPYSTNAYRNE